MEEEPALSSVLLDNLELSRPPRTKNPSSSRSRAKPLGAPALKPNCRGSNPGLGDLIPAPVPLPSVKYG